MAASRRWFTLVAVFLIGIFASYYAEKAPYTSFARNATSAPAAEYYDYIIVGGGTAGCALAATLSASAKVLLLERGGVPYGNPNVTRINNFGKLLADTSSPSSPTQQFVSTDGVFNHRGRVLGGSSAINAGFYSRASRRDVAEAGWEPRLVNASYEWVEAKVAFRPPVRRWQAAVREGLLAAGVLPYRGFTYKHLQGTKIGGSTFDQNGYRHTAADLLEYADPTKITVYLYATVHQILFRTTPTPGKKVKKPKAYGVLFRDSNGISHVAYLKSGTTSTNEIIICAGVLGSPQLLMLSGIGPGHQLRDKGITVILDQPMVGQGMSDNPMNGILIPSRRPVGVSLIEVVGITNFGSYIEAASRISFQTMTPSMAQAQHLTNQEGSDPYRNRTIRNMIILEKVTGPFSKGYLELQSNDPNENPRVTFNYFKDPRDLQRCVKGMKIVKRVIESRPVSAFRYPSSTFQSLVNLTLSIPTNQRRRHVSASHSMRQFCVDTVMTIWHYHGGCQVDRVVDRDYRVIGVDGLRVIDGSTFKYSPGTNPQATVMMLGRYMGQRILRERSPQ